MYIDFLDFPLEVFQLFKFHENEMKHDNCNFKKRFGRDIRGLHFAKLLKN